MGERSDAVIVLDAGPIIDAARRPAALMALLERAIETGSPVMTTDAIVAQVWRSSPEPNIARVLKSVEVESEFGDGKAIGALCAGEDDPDVERYAAKVGVSVGRLPQD